MHTLQLDWSVIISSAGIIFFTLLGCWALWAQNRRIWHFQSGKSISVAWALYFCFLYLSNMTYGVMRYNASLEGLALISNGILRLPFHVVILVGLWRFRCFVRTHLFLLIGLLGALSCMIVLPARDYFFLGFNVGGLGFLVLQPLAIWRNRSVGVYNVRVPLVMMCSSFFWVGYGFAIGDWVIQISSFLYIVVLAITLGLWQKYREVETSKRTI